jgi:Phytanoyl-CoA dioxygenase (PhyH)
MLTDEQVDHYQTFGFVVLPGWLDEPQAAELSQELDRALRDGYRAHFGDREASDDVFGRWLPMMSRQRTPISLGLVEDPRFLGAARQLLDGPVLPTFAEGYLLSGEAGFHSDCGTGSQGVKFVAYLEPLTAATGALQLLAGSHHPDFGAAIASWDIRHPAMDSEGLRGKLATLPCAAAETQPGDVIAFDWHTWHASVGGRDRRQWTISYAKDPATSDEAGRLRDFLASLVPDGDQPFDHHANPCYDRHWLDPDSAHPDRAALSARMRQLGVFEIAKSQ